MGKTFYSSIRVLGNSLLYKGFENGERVERRINYSPSLFFVSNKDEPYRTLEGRPVKKFSYKTIKDAKSFIYENKEVEGMPIYGYQRYDYTYLQEKFPDKIDFDFDKLKIINFDIETRSQEGFPQADLALQEIISIAISYRNRYFIFGLNDYIPKQDNHKFIKCEDEIDLLNKFIRIWNNINPDIITGWNILGFDIPYLVNRISRVIGFEKAKELSPYRYIRQVNVNLGSTDISTFDIYGIESLDYLQLYKKFTYKKRENYRLDTIANAELGEKKLDYSEYGSLHGLYANNYEKFIDYNIKDVDLVNKFEEKLKLIEMIVTTAYDAKINFSDVFHQVKIWENITYGRLIKKGIVFPPKKRSAKDEKFRGAYVKDSQVGIFDWVVSYDVNSLYPSLLIQNNISPETLIPTYQDVNVDDMLMKKEYYIEDNATLTASGYSFTKSRTGFLPEIIEEMIKERFEYRAKQKEYEKILDKINERILSLQGANNGN